MTTLAAIDVGSNAMRLAIGRVREDGRVKVIETVREPVRLGQDVFSRGCLSLETMGRAVRAFHQFSKAIRQHGAEHTAAIATSAMREAENGRDLTARIREETGIEVSVISGAEEARLMHLAVSRKLDIDQGEAMLVDIGGGSVELALTSDGLLIDSRSYQLGTVRMLQVLSDERLGPARFARLVDDGAKETREWLSSILGHYLIGHFIGTGGNVEAIGDLTGRRVGKKATSFAYIGDIDRTRTVLEALDLEDRRRELGLKDGRADVIFPATVVLQALMNAVWATTLVIPQVGLREGLLADIAMRRTPAAVSV